jgi:transcriptional regulator of arginine metabolism
MMKQSPLIQNIKALLKEHQIRSHYELSYYLAERGFENISQPQISRILKQIGALSIKNSNGESVYTIQHELMMPTLDTQLKELVIDSHTNQFIVMVETIPGSADIIARVIENSQIKQLVLATIAGDDNVMLIPESIKYCNQILSFIKQVFK